MNSVNNMYLVEASSSSIRLFPEEGIKQVGYIYNLSNSNI